MFSNQVESVAIMCGIVASLTRCKKRPSKRTSTRLWASTRCLDWMSTTERTFAISGARRPSTGHFIVSPRAIITFTLSSGPFLVEKVEPKFSHSRSGRNPSISSTTVHRKNGFICCHQRSI